MGDTDATGTGQEGIGKREHIKHGVNVTSMRRLKKCTLGHWVKGKKTLFPSVVELLLVLTELLFALTADNL
jgi:hypothetical protein